jgi:ubiquitin-protein ligase
MSLRKKYNKGKTTNLSLKDDNIYHWIVTFSKFNNDKLNQSLERVNSLFGYNTIQLEILFHDKLFPSYPPFLKILRPRMENSLMHRISNLKMVHFDYWTPSMSMEYVIDKMLDIFNTHAVIDVENEMNNAEQYPTGAYHDLEGILVKLASLCNVENQFEELDTTEYKRVYESAQTKSNSSTHKTRNATKKSPWAAGIGYGSSGSNNWNIDEYVQLQRERDMHIQSILQRITDVLMNSSSDELTSTYKILESSYLIPYIKTLFLRTTMVEIDKHLDLYKLIFTLLQFLITEDSIYLFDDRNGDKNLYEVLKDMNNDALTVQKISQDSNDNSDYDITSMITSLFEFVHSCYTPYFENKKKYEEEMEVKMKEKLDNKKSEEELLRSNYVTELTKYKFGMSKFINNGFYHSVTSTTDKKLLRAIGKECSTFNKSLPVHYGSSVLARVDTTNSRCMRVLITGPDNTPYDSGVYLFDVYAKDGYPGTNPLMQFINHGGVRFNPNLYADGKVCLSLLGTWRGEASENWNPKTSTLSQLFISVQAQILTDDPYYNEPGWELSYGTSEGIEKSKKYNNYIRQFNMQHAMLGIIEGALSGKYPEFKDAIIAHFSLKKDYILELCSKWIGESFSTSNSAQHNFAMNKEKYMSTFEKLKQSLDKLP